MKISCILIDDEPFALNILEDDLLQFPQIEVLAKFSSPLAVIDFLAEHAVDLIFSDIQMPEMLGTQFVRGLNNGPLIIFTTAFHQYALEGFELNVVDYLMKPIRKERLAVAIKKVEDQLRLRENQQASQPEDYIVVNVEYQKIKLLVRDILYIEGLKDYVKIYLVNRAHPLLTRSNLRGMESKLPAASFARIHNSFIVNKARVTALQPTKIFLDNVALPIGKKYTESIKSI
ncbi:LytTR family DNA-binding domain-containing protein [Sphingobacterium oryzagri]|uniref:LytTR family DNA-binding domain-containing protein n=1 Tax=Sphingobacterium oryzagri TaxID=3025669 RepID=A0ABY7WL10_9SPHI|nr:LytTR family DNA-binding domain-containing protein [Sphingobacterium sp. KACC 22765]WDF70296.1 LytTR family DNA-binding domain-containing protein [Sphingobacterium sp. KACC 22765]